jgi:ATP-dependent Clp protease ATP-binding subunit ClpC
LGLIREGEGVAAQVLQKLSLPSDSRALRIYLARGVNGMCPVIGREKEIERVMQVLSRRTKNNPALIGDPGWARPSWSRGWPRRSIPATSSAPALTRACSWA